jgi:hypothetical protein
MIRYKLFWYVYDKIFLTSGKRTYKTEYCLLMVAIYPNRKSATFFIFKIINTTKKE